MQFSRAIRASRNNTIAFTGGGGKTSALFMAARELAPALVTTSTHLAARQVANADRHILWESGHPLPDFPLEGVTLVTGPYREDIARVTAPTLEQLQMLREFATRQNLPLLIEADGSRQKPLKAPAEHEPAIPPFADLVIITAGMRGLDKPLNATFIHRPEIYGPLSGLQPEEPVSAEAAVRVLTHPQGGLKNIPPGARKVILLNQADTPELQSRAGNMAASLLSAYESVVVASIQREEIHAVHENIAGVILAAGAATRFGKPKQLLDYHGQPFIRKVAQTALDAGLNPVVVVTGAHAEDAETALSDLPIVITRNKNWNEGQSTSIRAGLEAVPHSGAVIFLLADQPQVTGHVLQALKAQHAQTLNPIIAPLIIDRRGNPVLFDRTTFRELEKLTGDVGGRAIFSNYKVDYIPWHDESLLFDVDTEADYRKLLAWGVEE